jgi:hypothetical protein
VRVKVAAGGQGRKKRTRTRRILTKILTRVSTKVLTMTKIKGEVVEIKDVVDKIRRGESQDRVRQPRSTSPLFITRGHEEQAAMS